MEQEKNLFFQRIPRFLVYEFCKENLDTCRVGIRFSCSTTLGNDHGTGKTDTDPNGYRDFFAKLAKKIPVSVESDVFLVP